jgi:signal transduction histidine kinase
MSELEISSKTEHNSTALALSEQRILTRSRKRTRLPWWREPPPGYFMTFPLVGLGLAVPYLFLHYGIDNAFLDTPLVLITLIIALVWGTEPAVLSILLGTLAFDVYFLPPYGSLLHNWYMLLQLVPFVLASSIMVALAAQRERGRRQLNVARQELQDYADRLVRANQELWQVNQELEKANQLKDHFLSMASHELKTPITTIRGHAQLGLRRLTAHPDLPADLEPLNLALDRIEQQTARLNNLIDDLLDLSILRSGKMTLRPTRFELGELCREVVQEQQSLSGRSIELETPSSPVNLRADRERISQVITNLVANAIKYSPGDSTIRVQVSQANRTVVIRVHNDGSFIPPEQQASIFEPFYRAPAAQTSSKKGWGLGLAISQQIVERHHGHIWVTSSQDNGTTFIVELPLVLKEG